MSVLSVLRPSTNLINYKLGPIIIVPSLRNLSTTSLCCQGGYSPKLLGGAMKQKKFVITPSRYQWNKYKDSLHFYFMLGVIPILIIVFLSSVFVGPATLTPIPEGYVPKQWEYFKHPISRFISRYLIPSSQERYERNLFYIHEEEEKKRMRLLTWRVDELMKHRGDYPNYYSNPPDGKYMRRNIISIDNIYKRKGNDISDTSIPTD